MGLLVCYGGKIALLCACGLTLAGLLAYNEGILVAPIKNTKKLSQLEKSFEQAGLSKDKFSEIVPIDDFDKDGIRDYKVYEKTSGIYKLLFILPGYNPDKNNNN